MLGTQGGPLSGTPRSSLGVCSGHARALFGFARETECSFCGLPGTRRGPLRDELAVYAGISLSLSLADCRVAAVHVNATVNVGIAA